MRAAGARSLISFSGTLREVGGRTTAGSGSDAALWRWYLARPAGPGHEGRGVGPGQGRFSGLPSYLGMKGLWREFILASDLAGVRVRASVQVRLRLRRGGGR